MDGFYRGFSYDVVSLLQLIDPETQNMKVGGMWETWSMFRVEAMYLASNFTSSFEVGSRD